MVVGLLISASMWAENVAPTREIKQGVPQVEIPQIEKPQPFAMVQVQGTSMRKAPKKAALSTEAITDDQVMLKVGETEIGLKSIVDAFKYVNTNCTASDSATIILQKNIDLAKDDYYTTGSSYYGVVLNADRKAVLDLNGFNFKSAIQTGSASGANDGKTSALIYNKGVLCLTDNTFDYASIKNADPTTISFDASSLCFFDESADTKDSPSYASNVVLNNGDLTIRGCKLSDTSYGPACYCVDQQTCSRDSITLWVESGFVYGRYAAVRQYFTNSTCRSKFVMNDGIFYAGSTCIWSQFCNKVDPKCEVFFSGGKCLAPKYYAYYNYPYGNNSTKDCSYNFSGTEFNSAYGNYVYGGSKDKTGEGTTINIYGGKNFANSGSFSYAFNTNYATINVYDGTFGDSKNTTYFACYGHHNTFNIMGGEFNNSYIYDCSSTGNNTWNISNGKFNNTYLYLNGAKSSTYNISGGVFTGSYSIYANSTSNCTFNLSDGTFGGYIADYGSNNTINVTGGLYRSDIYTFGKGSTIDITGGYYAYGRMAHGKAYDDADMYWTSYIHSGYVDVINGTCAEDMQPWVSDDEYYYFYKIGQETKTEIALDEEQKQTIQETKEITLDNTNTNIKEEGEEEERIISSSDNIVVGGDLFGSSSDDTTRYTVYLENLDVNGLTFTGKDTIDVIAKPGAVVNVGSSGIHADTTTVYLTVNGGGTMKVGVEGINDVDAVVVESSVDGNGTLLISPNAQLTDAEKQASVKLYIKGPGKVPERDKLWVWQQIAIPTDGAPAVTSNHPEVKTYVKWWDQSLRTANKWTDLTSWSQMNKPFQGYILTTSEEYNTEKKGIETPVTYSFTGKIIGNEDGQLHFTATGFNFFGNSYTAPINVQSMLNNINGGNDDVEMSVWIYSTEKVRYLESNNLMRLLGLAEFTEISSMQGFWLRNLNGDFDNSEIDYADAVWANPNNIENPIVKAPARAARALDYNLAQISVKTDDHQDQVVLVEGAEFSSSFDNGSDATKKIMEDQFNIYAHVPAGALGCLATNDLNGTMLAFQASDAESYTMSFNAVNSDEYELYDMMTGFIVAIKNGVEYTFSATPFSTTDRFLVRPAAKAPTALEHQTGFVKGVYSIVGLYLGETTEWERLPQGIYVIDGQKVMK